MARLKERLEKGEAKQLITNSVYQHYLKLAREKISLDGETGYDGRYLLIRMDNISVQLEEVAYAYKMTEYVD